MYERTAWTALRTADHPGELCCGSFCRPGLNKTLDEDTRFRLLRLLEQNPDMSQREIAKAMGMSLGGINYVLRALVGKGQVKVRNFRASDNKLRYAYVLTPRGAEAKARLTAGFLRRKIAEYEALKQEIAALEEEMALGGR